MDNPSSIYPSLANPLSPTQNQSIITIGKMLFGSIQAQNSFVFNKRHWMGKLMAWAISDPNFKTNLFRFVDVFPSLHNNRSLLYLLQEYLDNPTSPITVRFGLKVIHALGSLSPQLITPIIRKVTLQLAHQFIIGETTTQAIQNIEALRQKGFAFTVDVLGEATLNQPEADHYFSAYINLLTQLQNAQKNWTPLAPSSNNWDWSYSPPIQVSIKPTSLYWDVNPLNLQSSVNRILDRLLPLHHHTIQMGASLCIDMESYKYKNITLELYKRLRSHPSCQHYPHIGIALQAYLKETETDVDNLLQWSNKLNLPIQIRLVKGAYWDAETIITHQNGWPPPVWEQKHLTDAAFERLAIKILRHHNLCYLACSSHNIRSIACVLQMANELSVPSDRFEFQLLYGMAEPLQAGIKDIAGRVRLYCPYGNTIAGMAYLVRRLLENTSNESFLRQTFAEHQDIDSLLKNPASLS